MKEATGELSTTVIAIVAIAAVLTIFTVWLLPAMRSTIRAKTYCSSAVNCGQCTAGNGRKNGTMQCYYYDDNMNISTSTITCDCEVQ